MSEKPKSLAAKLAEITLEVERVAKRGKNDFHKYDYATEADIAAAIRERLASRGIAFLPRVTGHSVHEKPGDKGFVVYVNMTFSLLDGESGEVLEFPWLGCGEDKGDKAAYKALTGAVKYFLLKLFLIPTGDDPEKESKAPEKKTTVKLQPQTVAPGQEVLTPAEIEKVFSTAKLAGYKTSSELHGFTRQMFGVDSVKAVPRSGLDALLKAILPEPVSA